MFASNVVGENFGVFYVCPETIYIFSIRAKIDYISSVHFFLIKLFEDKDNLKAFHALMLN